jgi:hypothetical protein
VQPRPTAAELMDAVATLLDNEVLGVVPAELQHKVRVAANLCRIVQREASDGGALAEAERRRLGELLALPDAPLDVLRRALCERLDDPTPLDADTDSAYRAAIVATLRDDLRIAKPGYDGAS